MQALRKLLRECAVAVCGVVARSVQTIRGARHTGAMAVCRMKRNARLIRALQLGSTETKGEDELARVDHR